jgi:hypothetical protein
LRRASASRADIAQGGGAVNALTLWCRIHRRRRRSHFRRCGASTRADRTVRTGSNARCGTSRLGQRALAIAVVLAVTVLVLVAAAASFLAERTATSEYVGAVFLFQLLGAAPTKDVRALRRRTHHLSLADVTASVARHSMLRYANHGSAYNRSRRSGYLRDGGTGDGDGSGHSDGRNWLTQRDVFARFLFTAAANKQSLDHLQQETKRITATY